MYLAVTEDQEVFQVSNINDEDVQSIEHGILSIFKFEEGKFYELVPSEEGVGEWEKVRELK